MSLFSFTSETNTGRFCPLHHNWWRFSVIWHCEFQWSVLKSWSSLIHQLLLTQQTTFSFLEHLPFSFNWSLPPSWHDFFPLNFQDIIVSWFSSSVAALSVFFVNSPSSPTLINVKMFQHSVLFFTHFLRNYIPSHGFTYHLEADNSQTIYQPGLLP